MGRIGGCRIIWVGVGSLQCRPAGSDEVLLCKNKEEEGAGEGFARGRSDA